jgi:rhodanese-related sulfurtransferase
MAKTFGDLVAEARSQVEVLSPQEAQQRMQENPDALVLDVRQAEDLGDSCIPGAINIPLGVLPLRAATDLPKQLTDERLQDRNQQVIVTCGGGGQAALGAKFLKEMGFDNVAMVDGGTRGWTNAGLPTEKPK